MDTFAPLNEKEARLVFLYFGLDAPSEGGPFKWDAKKWMWIDQDGVHPFSDDVTSAWCGKWIGKQLEALLRKQARENGVIYKVARLGIRNEVDVPEMLKEEGVQFVSVRGSGHFVGKDEVPVVGSPYETTANGRGYYLVESSTKVGDEVYIDGEKYITVMNYKSRGDAWRFSHMHWVAILATQLT